MILSLFAISAITLYSWYSWIRSRENVHGLARQRTLHDADSCLSSTLQWLRIPTASSDVPMGGIKTLDESVDPILFNRCQVTLRRNAAPGDYISADVNSLSETPGGSTATIHATIRFTTVTQYFAAVDDTQPISAGTQLAAGSDPANYGTVYAPNLVFESGALITIGSAYYADTVSPSETPSNVQFFLSPYHAQKLPARLNVVMLDSSINQLYKGKSSPLMGPLFIDNSNTLPPSPTHVYFVEGDVTIGPQPLTVTGVYALYATGDIHILNNIGPALNDADSWIALLSEKTIHLDKDAPDELTLVGNFIANAGMIADSPDTPRGTAGGCSLSITGGVVGGRSLIFSEVWRNENGCSRTYQYKRFSGADEDKLYLPNVSTVLDYHVTAGRAVPLSQQTTPLPLDR